MRTRRRGTTWKRLATPALVAGLVLSTAALPAAGQDLAGAVEVTLLHDTHLHGKFGDLEPADVACPGGAEDAGFEDVPTNNVHRDAIACAVSHAIVLGISEDPPRFAPARSASRGQISSLIARTLDAAGVELPDGDTHPFTDIVGTTHEDNIARLHEAGIVEGHRDGTFRAGNPVRRDQMASLLVRTLAFAIGSDIEPDGGPHFDDVPSANVHASNVDAAFEYGLMLGKGDRRFDPRSSTRRDQMASIMTRLVPELELVGLANLGRYMALVQALKDAHDGNALFLGNGDDVAPSLLSGVFEPNGIHMIEALNVSPIDINTLANHEFDFGPDNLRELLEASEFPWVTANVRDRSSGQVFGADLGVKEFETFEVNGVTVGVTGLAPENMASITSLGANTEQIPAGRALDIVVPKMVAAGADLIVVSSHLCGTDAIRLADARADVDVFVGDHCADVREEPYVSRNGTIVSLAGDEFEFLGELTLSVLAGEVVGHEFTLHDLAEDHPVIAPHPAVQEVVDRYNAELDEQLNVVIGTKTVTWDTRTTVVRTGENAFGNFLTDQMRAFHDADIAVQNSGGIRANREFPDTDVTRRDIAEILPFANHLVKAEIRGSTILEALERSVDTYPDPSGAFLQVSGMKFTFDPSRPAGSRIVSVEIGGEPLVETRTYTMATNDFTLGGGDAYTMFRDDTTTLVGANEGPLLSTFLINQIDAMTDPITTTVEGRITAVD
jgi:5'-nucleotidase / UDP-sugar diphosphatase